MKITRIVQIAIIIAIAANCNGCASKSIAPSGFYGTQAKLSQDFWKNRTAKILIGVTPSTIQGQTYNLRRGADTELLGVIDQRVTDSLDKGLTNFVRSFDYSEILSIKSIFTHELSKREMQVLSSNDKALETQYQNLIKSNANAESIKEFRENNNVDYLILFQITKCGIINKGNSITGYRLRSTVGVIAYLIDLRTGNIEWKYFFNRREVSISGEWNQPPDYPNVATAIREAIKVTTSKLTESFFN